MRAVVDGGGKGSAGSRAAAGAGPDAAGVLTRLRGQAIHQMHRDIVYECPSGVERLGSSDRCEVQGMYARGRLLTVQGHPEFNEAVVTELLERRHEQGIFDDGMFKDGLSRVQEHHDGVAVGVAFLRFLLEE